MELDNGAEFFAYKDYSIIPNVKGRIADGKHEMKNVRFINYSEPEKIVTVRIEDPEVPNFWCDIPICLNQLENYIDTQIRTHAKRPRSNAVSIESNTVEFCDHGIAWF
jgi:hypothetical protein